MAADRGGGAGGGDVVKGAEVMDTTAEDYQAPMGIDPNVVYPVLRPNNFTMGGVDYVSGYGTTLTAVSAKDGLLFVAGAVLLIVLVSMRR